MTCLGSPFFLPYFFATQKSQQRNRNTLTVSVSLCDLQQQKSGVLYPNPSSKSAILARSCVKRYFGSSLRRQLFWPKKRYLKDTYTVYIPFRFCTENAGMCVPPVYKLPSQGKRLILADYSDILRIAF